VSFVHSERVRFRDLDALGHVNNAIFATYLEQARIEFLRRFGATQQDMILARLEIDFRAPVGFGEDVEIEVRPTGVGRKSFGLDYTMRVDERVVAEAKSVLVAYDYQREESVELPARWREALAA
jgi:acyl-CoA thioester hydrolase